MRAGCGWGSEIQQFREVGRISFDWEIPKLLLLSSYITGKFVCQSGSAGCYRVNKMDDIQYSISKGEVHRYNVGTWKQRTDKEEFDWECFHHKLYKISHHMGVIVLNDTRPNSPRGLSRGFREDQRPPVPQLTHTEVLSGQTIPKVLLRCCLESFTWSLK